MEARKFEVSAAISSDGTTAHLTFKGEPIFDAAALEQLAKAIGTIREKVGPPVAADPPRGTLMTALRHPAYFVHEAPMDGGAIISVRHPGFGWIHSHFPHDVALRIAGLLDAWSRPPGAGSNVKQ